MKRYAALLLVIALLVSACGGGDAPEEPTTPQEPTVPEEPNTPEEPAPNTAEVSGTVTAPAGTDIVGTIIFACFVEGNACNIESENTTGNIVEDSGSSVSFSVDLPPGNYTVEAYKDVNGNDLIDVGDYYGCFGQQGDTCRIVNPGSDGIAVQMEIVTEDGGVPERVGGAYLSH